MPVKNTSILTDLNAENRKKDHIALAFESQVDGMAGDKRFYYEPVLGIHPVTNKWHVEFLGKQMQIPLWVSSMTGGTEMAGTINRNLAQVCAEFGMGMGLGSCRSLLYDKKHFADFNMRPIIGKALPFFANLGVAQVELLLRKNNSALISDLVGELQADGLIVHVNPLQEWLQPEGDRFLQTPINTITDLLERVDFPVVVKEVGQGFGPASIRALLQLPIAALDFGALGGTNFSKLELLRNNYSTFETNSPLTNMGHTADEMVDFVNNAIEDLTEKVQCREIIISGGIHNFTDGYFYMGKIHLNAVYAQASAFLRYAREDYSTLRNYVKTQADGLALCRNYLTIRS